MTKKKKDAWESLRANAAAAGVASLSTNNWQYVWDSVWSAAQKNSITKRSRQKSGPGRVQYNLFKM